MQYSILCHVPFFSGGYKMCNQKLTHEEKIHVVYFVNKPLCPQLH